MTKQIIVGKFNTIQYVVQLNARVDVEGNRILAEDDSYIFPGSSLYTIETDLKNVELMSDKYRFIDGAVVENPEYIEPFNEEVKFDLLQAQTEYNTMMLESMMDPGLVSLDAKGGVSANYDRVKTFYDKGLWNATKVKMAVKCKWITAEEYNTITGEEYVA